MNQEKQYHPLPQPDEIPVREREDAMGAYLMMFAAIGAGLPMPVINLIASVIYYYINRAKSRFVHFHSLQSMLAQLPVSVLNAVGVFWAIQLLVSHERSVDNTFIGYVCAAVIANIIYFIFSIIAAVKARKGRMYYFWFFGRISYQAAYAVRDVKTAEAVNLPPSP